MSETVKNEVVRAVLTKMYQSAGHGSAMETTSLQALLMELSAWIDRREYQAVDDLLEHADLDQLSTVQIVALVRYPFPVRTELKRWVPVLTRVHLHFVGKGQNANELLGGLMEHVPGG
jgi:hypothetical protein